MNRFQMEIEKVARIFVEHQELCKQAIGFSSSIKHRGILFYVGRQFVIADLSPLAFLHLVEQIDEEGADAAVARLYERLPPLLACKHKWNSLTRSSDLRVDEIAKQARAKGSRLHVCESCTAYAQTTAGAPLPVTGRT